MTRTTYGRLAMAFVIASLIVFEERANAPMQANQTPRAVEFLRIARGELAAGGELKEAARYLLGLSPLRQIQVAHAIGYDPDARIGYFAANVLIQRGRFQEAAPMLADIIASGRSDTQLNGRMGYDWIHGDDETLLLRMSIMINRYLLANLAKYEGDRRVRVEATLMGGLLERSTQPFSKEAAKRLLAEWQASLDKHRRERGKGSQ